MKRSWQTLLLLLFLAIATSPSVAITPVSMGGDDDAGIGASPATAIARSERAVVDPPEGVSCSLIDFEGLGNHQPIPKIDGISSTGWVAVIDSDAGGTGDTAWEPSPDTWADWPGGVFGTGRFTFIDLDVPASHVSLFYSSAVQTLLSARDSENDLLDAVDGPPNYNQGPGGDPTGFYNKWDQLAVESDRNDIAQVKVSGAWGQTAIDDLLVCRRLRLAAAEFTQAIQQLQSVEELKADLLDDGQPPVPIVAHKPAALRLYFDEVLVATNVVVEVNIDGYMRSQSIVLMPGCTSDDARRGRAGCASADFYFKPQSGTWPVTVRVKTESGYVVEEHSFSLTSRQAEPLVLGAVRVCDAKDNDGRWLCENDYVKRLNELVVFLRRIAPTFSVRVSDTLQRVLGETDGDGNGEVTEAESDEWWADAALTISDLHGLFDGYRDFYGIPDRRYYGMSRPETPGRFHGMAGGTPSRGALSRSFATNLDVDVSADIVAHETGHMLGRQHSAARFPELGPVRGCWSSTAAAPDWPFADNELRSGDAEESTVEVGFDVAARRPLPHMQIYDVMGYCLPQWISPFTYTRILDEALDPSMAAQPAVPPGATSESGVFWQVSGTIDGQTDLVAFRPLFEVETTASTDQGSGNFYYILVRDASDAVLFIRYFDAQQPEAYVVPGAEEPEFAATFTQLVPVQPSAARLEVYHWTGMKLGTLELTGDAPDVQIVAPTGGGLLQGEQTISWTVTDADSEDHYAWVQYSTDPGSVEKWRTLARGITDDELLVDFDELDGGSDGAVVRVLVSDGVNMGMDATDPFEVEPKLPEAAVLFPPDQSTFQQGQLVWLQGIGLDADDGSLEDDALAWESDLDGPLGTGEEVQLTMLSAGTHEITLTATDSDANAATATIDIVVAGAGPTVVADVEALDSLPTTCVAVTLDAEAGSVPLEEFEYSLDNGQSWTEVPVAELPYEFVVPGSGAFHLVARAVDESGQVDVTDQSFLTYAPCTGGSTTTTTLAPPVCGDPSGDEQIKSSDALLALRAAVSSYECAICVCDANGSGSVEASDALRILRKSVGHDVDLVCPAC